MTPEGEVKKEVLQGLAGIGAYYFMPVQTGFGKRTVDILACYKGRFIAIECKAGKNKPTLLQVRELEAIRSRDGVAVVVNDDNWDMIRELVKGLKG